MNFDGPQQYKNMNEIREDEYILGKMSRSEEDLIVAKNYWVWYDAARFWQPHLVEGQDNWEALEGRSFTDQELRRYEAEDKEAVEVPIILPKIQALQGMQRQNRKDGVVVAQGGAEDAASAEVVNVLLKTIRQQNNLDQERSQVFLNAVVGCYPAWIWIDEPDIRQTHKKLDIYAELWNAVLPDKNFKRVDGSDLEYIVRVKLSTRDSLIAAYPERKDEILKRCNQTGPYGGPQGYENIGSNERNLLISSLNDAQTQYERTGQITVIERLHFIDKEVEVFVSTQTGEAQILPPEWSDFERQTWIQNNQDHEVVQETMKVLYVTTSTLNGVLLENRPHWFQEGVFPGAMYIPAMFNNQPVGPLKYMKASQKMNSVGRTEYVHSLRYAHDQLMIVKEGALTDPEEAAIEKSKTGGVITINDDAEIQDVQFIPGAQANSGYIDISAIAQDDLDTISAINPAMLGFQESANESNVSQERRISQSQTAQGNYMDNFNLFDQQLHRVLLMMIPYVYKEYEILRHVDDLNNVQETSVNEPAAINPLTGAVTRIKNRLDAIDYDYLLAAGDNSISGREHENRVFLQITADVLSQMPQELWSSFLSNVPNRHAQDFAQQLMQQEEAQKQAVAEGTQQGEGDIKMNLNIDGEDIATANPLIIEVLKRKQVLSQDTQVPQEQSHGQVKEQQEAILNAGVQEENPNE
jgi:hypothetical protein